MRRLVPLCLFLLACRVEWVSPRADAAAVDCSDEPQGELWVYTSIYRSVLDALDPLIKKRLPKVHVQWFQAGSEKVANRLEAELAAGGTQADLLATADPFLFERLKEEGRLYTYASPYALRFPRELVDVDGAYAAARLSTMVLVYRSDLLGQPPKSFGELSLPAFRGQVAVGDALLSGTAATWALFMMERYGAGYFQALRDNQVVVAGGNSAVQQKLESGEAKVGVLLLENALVARGKGSPLAVQYPTDGAVVVPGNIAIFKSTKNPLAAKALYDFFLSPEGQRAMVEVADLHAVDPRLPGPRGEPALPELLARAQPWSEALRLRGVSESVTTKAAFSRAFAK